MIGFRATNFFLFVAIFPSPTIPLCLPYFRLMEYVLLFSFISTIDLFCHSSMLFYII